MDELPDNKTKPRRLLRMAIRSICLLISVYLGVVMLLVFLQRKLIYHPHSQQIQLSDAGELQDHVSEVNVTAVDGITLHGWHVSRRNTSTERRLVILFPGNAGNRSRRVEMLKTLMQLDHDVLIVDYRGYADNEGSPSEAAFTDDSHAVWKHAREELGYDADQIVLCGQSLGGGVATRLAHDLCESGEAPAGLVLRATFSSLVDAAKHRFPWLPVDWMLVDRFPSIERISKVTCPILSIHGKRDRVVPFVQGKALFDAAPETSESGVKKRFLPLPKAGHNDIPFVAGAEVKAALKAFFESIEQTDPSFTL